MKLACTGNFRKARLWNNQKVLLIRNPILHDAACKLRPLIRDSWIKHLKFQPDTRLPARPHGFEIRRVQDGLAVDRHQIVADEPVEPHLLGRRSFLHLVDDHAARTWTIRRWIDDCDANIVIHGALIAIERKTVLYIPPHPVNGNNARERADLVQDLRERPRVYGTWTRQVLQLGALFTAADFVRGRQGSSVLALLVAAAPGQASPRMIDSTMSAVESLSPPSAHSSVNAR